MTKLTAHVDGMTITITVETITPAYAEELLKKNTRNRTIVQSSYAKVKRSMERDEWVFNGDAVRIANTDRILDGQHRLTACVETGKSFTTVVVRGLRDDTQRSMDSGAKRTLAQKLKIEGVKNAAPVATIATHDTLRATYGLARATNGITGNTNTITDTEAFEAAIRNNDQYQRLAMYTQRLRTHVPLPSGVLALLITEFESIDQEDADDFWERVKSGEMLREGHPIFTLRHFYRGVFEKEVQFRTSREIAAMTIKAWNAYRRGEDLKQLKFRAGGAKPEKFPEVI